MWISVQFAQLAFDPRDGAPVVVLADVASGRALPVWLDPAEADAISRAARGDSSEVATGADLVARVIAACAGRVEKVTFAGIRAGVVCAEVHIQRSVGAFALETHFSDALAIALRTGAPLLIASELLAEVAARVQTATENAAASARVPVDSPEPQTAAERWNILLDHWSSQKKNAPEA